MLFGKPIFKKRLKIKSSLKEIPPVIDDILANLKIKGLSDIILHDIKLVTEEALINAMKHGNNFTEELPVELGLVYFKNRVRITVRDAGKGYEYKKVPDPTLDENLGKGHGRGVFLIRELMDKVRFNKTGNKIEMVKYIR